MRFSILIWIALFSFLSHLVFGQPTAKTKTPGKAGAKVEKETLQLQYFAIRAEAGTYGYDIYADGNLYIHQPTIPSQPGSRGFADTAHAGKVARLAMDKMRQGQMPPTIAPEELHKLGIPVVGKAKP